MKKFSMIFITLMMLFALVFLGCNNPGGPGGDEDPPEPVDLPWTFEAGDLSAKLTAQTPEKVNGVSMMSFSNDISFVDGSAADGRLDLANSRYLVIGSEMKTATTATASDSKGQLDLSKKAKITVEYTNYTAVTDTTKEPQEGFQILVNNNTSTGASSVLGGASRIYGRTVANGGENDTVLSTGGGVLIVEIDPAALGNHASLEHAFITLRSASGASTTISRIKLEYIVEGVAVTGVSIQEDDVTGLENGDTIQLHAVFAPANATNQNVTWDSSDDAIATVSETGLVTAKADSGTATITVTAEEGDGAFTDSITVSVAPAEVAAIEFGIPYTLRQADISATDWMSVTTSSWDDQGRDPYPSETTDMYVNMSESGRFIEMTVSGVAEVSFDVQNGTGGRTYTVTIGNGTPQDVVHGGNGVERSTFATGTVEEVTIKIAGKQGSVYPLAVIFKDAVSAAPPAQYVFISGGNSVKKDETLELSAAVIPNNAAQTVTWSISEGNNTIATITPTGVLTGVEVGTAKVKAVANGTEIFKELTVNVTPAVDDQLGATIFVLNSAESPRTLALTQTLVQGAAWVDNSTNNWTSRTGASNVGEFGDASYYNMSSSDRFLTLRLSGVAEFELFVQNSNSTRDFTVKIDDGEAVYFGHTGSGIESKKYATGNSGECTVIIAGGGSGKSGTVHPLGVKLRSEVSE